MDEGEEQTMRGWMILDSLIAVTGVALNHQSGGVHSLAGVGLGVLGAMLLTLMIVARLVRGRA
jgi:hypothetical protein